MDIDNKITKILEEHGEGSGSDPTGLDDKAEKKLNVLSEIQEKKDNDGPVPEELQPYTKESAFRYGYLRTMKLAGLLKQSQAGITFPIGKGWATDVNTLPSAGVAHRAKGVAERMSKKDKPKKDKPKKDKSETTMAGGGQKVQKRKAGPGGATA